MFLSTLFTAEQLAEVHDSARRHAEHLRRAAIADFWRCVYCFVSHALRAMQRAGTTATRVTTTTATRQPTGV